MTKLLIKYYKIEVPLKSGNKKFLDIIRYKWYICIWKHNWAKKLAEEEERNVNIIISSIWIGILILLFFLLVHINVNLKKKFKFSTRVIISTVLGFAVGIVFQSTLGMVGAEQVPDVIKNVTTAASLVGRGFTSLLKMVVIPLVGLSVL